FKNNHKEFIIAIAGKSITKRSLEAQKTRKKIFDSAISLFKKHGYDTVTISDITSMAGVSKGNFYHYFESKDAVLIEQFRQIDSYYDKEMKEHPPTASVSDRALDFIYTVCDYCENVMGIDMTKIVYMNQINIGEKARILIDQNRKIYKIFTKLVRQGQEKGEFTKDLTCEDIVELLVSFTRSILYEWCLYDGRIDMKDRVRRYLSIVLNGLRDAESGGAAKTAKSRSTPRKKLPVYLIQNNADS
ncbi:MAG: TetR/AcrR family transcriptional regulator, partial [Treponema sp.]|nr:TetR/AcrR family transcriptional regulator [Treponema sp.]